jgi:hypothetical protein
MIDMNNKEILKHEEEKMKVVYSAEPCHLLKGIAVAFILESVALISLLLVAKLIANLFM